MSSHKSEVGSLERGELVKRWRVIKKKSLNRVILDLTRKIIKPKGTFKNIGLSWDVFRPLSYVPKTHLNKSDLTTENITLKLTSED